MGFKDVFKKTLPFLATAVPLPPPIGNFAAKVIGEAIGAPDLKPDGVDEALSKTQMTPEVIERLKTGENTFREHMTQMGFDTLEKLEEIEERDRESARNREIQTKDSWTPRILAFCAIAGLYGITAAVMKLPIPQAAHDLLLILIGSMVGDVKSVYNYYFGSSSGSADKSKVLSDIAKG